MAYTGWYMKKNLPHCTDKFGMSQMQSALEDKERIIPLLHRGMEIIGQDTAKAFYGSCRSEMLCSHRFEDGDAE